MADLWYYAKNGQQMDPVSAGELKRMSQVGELRPTDLIWKAGMASWIAAGSVPGLFPKGEAAAPRPRPRPRDEEPVEEPVEEPADETPEEEDEEERPRRRRRKKRKQGMGMGAVIGMVVGGIVLVLLVVGGVAAMMMFGGSSSSAMSGSFNWSLGQDRKATFYVTVKPGHRCDFTVRSNGRSDVDLEIYDGGTKITEDVRIDPNCFATVTAPAGGSTKTYKAVVWNRVLAPIMPGARGMNSSNSGTLSFRQMPAGSAPPVPPVAVFNPPPVFNPPAPAGGGNVVFEQNGFIAQGGTQNYTVPLEAGKVYTIDMVATTPNFDPLLRLEDSNGMFLQSDDDGGGFPNARIIYTPQQAGQYRVIASTFGGNDTGNFRLTVRAN